MGRLSESVYNYPDDVVRMFESYLIYNQINYKDIEIVINGNNNKWKNTYGNQENMRYLPYNKISNIIYMVNYNLLLNILNTPPQTERWI